MVAQARAELFGSCTNIGECEAVCPKNIKIEVIARMNKDFIKANWTGRGAMRDDEALVETSDARAGTRR
jgi:succinate dehydrogenase / fumarate reductase iron-sulfur subunit